MDEDQRLQERIRRFRDKGQLSSEDLDLYAYLGDEAACVVQGQPVPVAIKLSDWVWGISQWGQPTLVRMCVGLARRCLPVAIEHKRGEEDSWTGAFDIDALEQSVTYLERHLSEPTGQLASQLDRYRGLAGKAAEDAEFCDYEAGSEERNRAAAAYVTAARAFTVMDWRPEEVEAEWEEDSEELQARLAAGPAFEALEAVRDAKRACRWTDEQAKEAIREILIPWRTVAEDLTGADP